MTEMTGTVEEITDSLAVRNGESGMWKDRANSLLEACTRALVELRDRQELDLDMKVLSEFLSLGQGVNKVMLRGRYASDLRDLPPEVWLEMPARAGMIELYLRALNGEFSEETRDALKAFFDSLPVFSLDKALRGDPQDPKCKEQYGYLQMQIVRAHPDL